jgi:hypothetical protein
VPGSRGVNRSVSTPCGATSTGTSGWNSSCSRSAVGWLTQTRAAARREAALIIRGKNRAFDRSCHSGWSIIVRSWMVTTAGTRLRSGIV